MYYSYEEIEYVATSFSPTRTDLALKLLSCLFASPLQNGYIITFAEHLCGLSIDDGPGQHCLLQCMLILLSNWDHFQHLEV